MNILKKIDNVNYNFMKNRKIFFIIPIIILAAAIIFAFTLGVNMDVKFKGGTIINVPYSQSVDMEKVQEIASRQLEADCIVQSLDGAQSSQLVITSSNVGEVTSQMIESLLNELKENFPENITVTEISDVGVTNVDSQIRSNFFKKSLIAIFATFVAIIVYIGIRFRNIGGVSAAFIAILALIHDIAFVFATMVFCRFVLSDVFIAVTLIVLGYSLNNTIVVFDRIRENRKLLGKEEPVAKIVNVSINQILSRSVNISLIAVFAILVVLIIGLIYHVNLIVTFTLPLIVGILASFYMSIFVSGLLWVIWKEKHPNSRKSKRKKKKSKKPTQVDEAAEEINVRTSFKINKKAAKDWYNSNEDK